MNATLEPILALARKSGAHVLLVYHAGKGEKSDAVDSPLGSTAFAAAADTVLTLKRTERYRTLQSVQRYGAVDLPETVLDFDSERRAVLLGVEKSQADTSRTAEAILEHMAAVSGHATEPEICEAVEGRVAVKRTALRALLEQGKVVRAGGGKKGDPYLYCLPSQFSYSCSQDIPGTRIRETQSTGHPTETQSQMLVPEIFPECGECAGSREQETEPSGAEAEVEI